MSESDKKACEVPFLELLDKVPADVRVHIDTPNSLGVDTEIIPVGIYCRRAAAEIRELRRMISELRKEETNLNELLNACYISPENRHPVARLNHAHGVSVVRSVKVGDLRDGEYGLYLGPRISVRPVTPLACPKCNALWLFWPKEQSGFEMDTLSVKSEKHCDYCENASAEQLSTLGIAS